VVGSNEVFDESRYAPQEHANIDVFVGPVLTGEGFDGPAADDPPRGSKPVEQRRYLLGLQPGQRAVALLELIVA